MESANITEEYDKKVQENFIFKVKGSTSSYRLITQHGIVTGGYCSDHWAHKEKTSYYQLMDIPNSLFPHKPVFVKEVSWFVPQVTTEGLISGVYHVYLRHGAKDNMVMPTKTDVTIFVETNEDYLKVGSANPFNSELISVLKSNNKQLMASYVCTLDLSDFSSNESINVKVQIAQTDGGWKGNWLFEGVVFVPAASLENIPLFIQFNIDPKNQEIPKTNADCKMIFGKIKLPPGFVDREKPTLGYAQEKKENFQSLLDTPFDQSRKIRPVDLFSLDDTFYEDLENFKFYCARITRTGNQTGTFNVLSIIEDANPQDILRQDRAHIGIADIVQTSDFLSEGFEKGYFNWVQIVADNGKLVRMLHLDTACGSIQNAQRRTLSLDKLLWAHDAPNGRLSWRWYVATNGANVAAITIE